MARTPSKWERYFKLLWRAIEGPEYVAEYAFAAPVRRFRFDVAWPNQKVFVELHGATWVTGRHNTGKGLQGDCDKHNLATLMGWRGLYFTGSDLQNRSAEVLDQVHALLREAESGR